MNFLYFIKNYDLGIGEITYTYNRWRNVDFSYPYLINSMTFVTSVPKLAKNLTFVYQVFEANIWLTIIFFLFLFNFLLGYIKKSQEITFSNLVRVILSQQMSKFKPKTNFELILFYLWILSISVLTLIYSNCIYSYMIVPSKTRTIDTVYELYESAARSEITVCLIGGGSTIRMFKVLFVFNLIFCTFN